MKEVITISVRLEYLFALYAANHNVVDGIGGIYAGSSPHDALINLIHSVVKEQVNKLTASLCSMEDSF